MRAHEFLAGAIVASASRVWIKRNNADRYPPPHPGYEEWWTEATTYAAPISNAEVDEMLDLGTVELLRPLPGTPGQAVAATPTRRLRTCVEAWPEAETGEYDPRCCLFPKSCSATVYLDGTPDELLEPPAMTTSPKPDRGPNYRECPHCPDVAAMSQPALDKHICQAHPGGGR